MTDVPNAVRSLAEKLAPLVSGGADACLKGTPMIPLHRDTVAAIYNCLQDAADAERGPPKAICGYPLPGWRLDAVRWDERQGQPDGWIVSLKRNYPELQIRHRSVCVMSRSDVGPLEAWDEALRVVLRENARESERAIAMEARKRGNAETPKDDSAAIAQNRPEASDG